MYQVIVGYQKEGGLEKLEKDVKKAMKKGWKPQGGICVIMSYNHYNYYYQAMVKSK